MANIKKPRIVAFEVTRRCKMNCVHCRASARADFPDDLTTAQCKKIIKAIADYNRCVLIFTGGEPFERDDIFELIEYANSCRLAVSLATCGYDFDKERAERLKKAGVLTLSFSLDSDNAKEHDNFRQTSGAYATTLAAIDIAKTAGLKFQINTTVTKLNADKLPAIARLSESLGAYCFNPFMLVPAGRGSELADISLSPKEYEKVLHTVADLKAVSQIDVRFTCAPRFAVVSGRLAPAARGGVKVGGCLAASDFAFISHAGDVQTCGFLKISAGNILQTGDFASIWENSDFLNSIRQMKFGGKGGSEGGCASCNFVQICGGCRARAYAHCGDYLASDPLCCLAPAARGGAGHCERLVLRSFSEGRSEAISSTLIAAHIEDDKIAAATDAVNALPGVSHNYLRRHHYNLWFTLKLPICHFDRSPDSSGRSGEIFSIEEVIKELSAKFKTEFLSFPSTVRYKLDSNAIKKHNPPETFNALLCFRAGGAAAEYLCQLPQVSHCYERQTLTNWPYNIYAMIHEKSVERIEQIVTQVVSEFKISKFQILPTIRSLKN
ncbi:MAG: radical SAM protein [Phycisphaerae bacterium]